MRHHALNPALVHLLMPIAIALVPFLFDGLLPDDGSLFVRYGHYLMWIASLVAMLMLLPMFMARAAARSYLQRKNIPIWPEQED